MENAPPVAPAAPAATDHGTRGGNRWLVLALMCSGLLLAAMDNTILNVALPAIAEALQPGKTALLWIVDTYSLVVAGLLVTAGTAADRFGRRRFFLLGLLLFGVASVVAALSGSVEVLIASRVLRAVGGAMIMPATLSIIRTVFTDARERGVAIGIWSATAAAGSVVGPVVAGAALQSFPWGSVFLVGLPVVVAAMVLTIIYVPESRDPNPGPFDPLSVLLSMGGMVGIVYGIKEIAAHGFGAVPAVVALLVGLMLAIVFVRRQGKLEHPLLDLSLFRERRFSAATLTVLLSFFGFFGMIFFLTQYFQLLRGASALETGLWLLPMALASIVAAPLTEKMIRSWGSRVTLTFSFGLQALTLAVFALLGNGFDDVVIVVGFAGVGFGASIAVTAGSQAIMTSVSPWRAGSAAAIQETSFELGGGLGIALLGSVMTAVYGASFAAVQGVPDATVSAAAESLPAATAESLRLGESGAALMDAARSAFFEGLTVVSLASAGVMLITAVTAFLWLPNRADERAQFAAAGGAGGH
ncbi:MFS transporter [Lentzea sp. NPDC051213]|uniref:MFS transporter n=1 Tax=Lentzea sp. NPDC051213 TaxID=3364126 RepID=UPI003799FCAD